MMNKTQIGDIIRLRHLAMRLSNLPAHPCNSLHLEQYATEGDFAAKWLMEIQNKDSFENKSVVDLGAGNGILGIGAYFLGAAEVTLIESDYEVAQIAMNAIKEIETDIERKISVRHETVIGRWPTGIESCDLVIMNPPWGRQTKEADRVFIDAALCSPAEAIHMLHSSNATHPQKMAKESGWITEILFDAEFRIPGLHEHQHQKMSSTRATAWRFSRK